MLLQGTQSYSEVLVLELPLGKELGSTCLFTTDCKKNYQVSKAIIRLNEQFLLIQNEDCHLVILMLLSCKIQISM